MQQVIRTSTVLAAVGFESVRALRDRVKSAPAMRIGSNNIFGYSHPHRQGSLKHPAPVGHVKGFVPGRSITQESKKKKPPPNGYQVQGPPSTGVQPAPPRSASKHVSVDELDDGVEGDDDLQCLQQQLRVLQDEGMHLRSKTRKLQKEYDSAYKLLDVFSNEVNELFKRYEKRAKDWKDMEDMEDKLTQLKSFNELIEEEQLTNLKRSQELVDETEDVVSDRSQPNCRNKILRS